MLTSTSVWLVRNQSLMEMWWLFTSLMRYPREIFAGPWAAPLGWFFTFVLPVLLVVNVPAADDGQRARAGHGRRSRWLATVVLLLAQPAVLPPRAAELPQREQLSEIERKW